MPSRLDSLACKRSAARKLSGEEVRELFIGTWTAVALITEALIQQALVSRSELLDVMQDAQSLAGDQRATSIAGVKMLIERFGRD